MNFRRFAIIGFVIFTMTFFAVACDLSGKLTKTLTEEEFNEQLVDTGLSADFEPRVIIISGEIKGLDIVMDIIFEVTDDGGIATTITNLIVDGESFDPAVLGLDAAELSKSVVDEGRKVISIEILDGEMIVVSVAR